MVYFVFVSSKHESEFLFQNLAIDIIEVQILRGIVLLGGDFNVHIAPLPYTIDINNLCELLHSPDLVETEQPCIVARQQNRDTNVDN